MHPINFPRLTSADLRKSRRAEDINLTDSFTDSFGIVDIMTQGGPARATDLMVYKIYFDGFKGLDYSGAAAQSIILMLLVIALTFIQFRFIERRVHYT